MAMKIGFKINSIVYIKKQLVENGIENLHVNRVLEKKKLTQIGPNFLRCSKILSHRHPFLYFLPSPFLPCKVTFMDDYDRI
jgi:hypothetical protein